jgi:aconitase A
MDFDFETEPLGTDQDGNDVFLRDIWPTPEESRRSSTRRSRARCSPSATPTSSPATSAGRTLPTPDGETFEWDDESTYVRKPPYFDGMPGAGAGHRHLRRARAGQARRLGDDRPHQRRPARSRPTARPA